MEKVREFMGVCPQHDVIFEFLTVEEHLSVYYEIKGGNPDPSKKRAEIDRLIEEVGLTEYRDSIANCLSGGNKRKLCVALALIADSKFVLLDEPSSGLDLEARRRLWTVLKKYKKDRIVILTTHYMDEADVLGDRIGIMANGQLTCLGSSMFLKNKFGQGFNLEILVTSSAKVQRIMSFMHKRLGNDVTLQSVVSSEVKILVPSHYEEKFKTFFEEFEAAKERLCIESYSLSISTLEEVFHRVGHLDDPSKVIESTTEAWEDKREPLLDKEEETFIFDRDRDILDSSFSTNLKAVFYKRLMTYSHNS